MLRCWLKWNFCRLRRRRDLEKTDGFQTLSYCRDQAIERMKAIQVGGGGDYLCGHKCGPPREPGGPELCEETRK